MQGTQKFKASSEKKQQIIEGKGSRTSPQCQASPSAREEGKFIKTSSPCHLQILQDTSKHPLLLYLFFDLKKKKFQVNLNTLTGVRRGCSQLDKCQLCMVLIAFHGGFGCKRVSSEHRDWHSQYLNLEMLCTLPPLLKWEFKSHLKQLPALHGSVSPGLPFPPRISFGCLYATNSMFVRLFVPLNIITLDHHSSRATSS